MNFNKKVSLVLLGFMMLSFFAISFVSAPTVSNTTTKVSTPIGPALSSFFNSTGEAMNPVTTFLFGSEGAVSADNSLITWAAFFLTLLVVAGVLSPFTGMLGGKKGVVWGIAAIISLLGVRFIPMEALRAYTLGSESLVGALFLVIPFVIIASLIIKGTNNAAVRKILWASYATVMFALLVYKWNSSEWNRWYWTYGVIAIICLVLFWMDGTLQRALNKGKQARNLAKEGGVAVVRQRAKVSDLQDSLRSTDDETERKAIEKQIRTEKMKLDELTRYGAI